MEARGCYCVATISRLLKIIGLFCKRDLYKRDEILQMRRIIFGTWRSVGVSVGVQVRGCVWCGLGVVFDVEIQALRFWRGILDILDSYEYV